MQEQCRFCHAFHSDFEYTSLIVELIYKVLEAKNPFIMADCETNIIHHVHVYDKLFELP